MTAMAALRRTVVVGVQQPALRLISAVWPPTRRSIPGYLVVVLVMYVRLYFGHIRAVRTKEAEAEDERKRKHVLVSMRNLLHYEQNGCGSEDGDEGAAGAKKEADAKKLHGLIFDDIENGPVTKIGIAPDHPDLVEIKRRLGVRARKELRSAIDRTRAARAVPRANEHKKLTDEDGVFTRAEYADGVRLSKCLKFHKEQVQAHFPDVAAPKELLAEAKTLSKEIAGARSQARQRIRALVMPHFPKWLCGTLLLMVSETLWGLLHSMTLSLPHTLTTVIDGGTKARAARSCLTMGLAYLLNFPIDTLGDVLVDDVEAEVLLKLRSSVMATILSQDREYFDAHQVGELQERLNRDTAEVARSAIAQPKALLSILTRIATNTGVLLTISPRLAWLALCVPVPFSIIVAVMSLKQTRKQNRKIGRVNDRAAAGTIEVLREVTTVRQFGMERIEVAKFCETATWRMQLERRLRVSSMLTQYSTLQAFEASRLLNIFWGVGLCVAGELEATRLLMAVINLQQVVNNTRGLFNLLPQFFMVMEPLERLAALLEARPKIEPGPESYTSDATAPEAIDGSESTEGKHGRRPATYTGRIVFENVHFAYPAEKQKKVLQGLSLTVEPGQKVALVGKAGCGKSTAITLMQRFYDPGAGTISLDGFPLQSYDLHHLRAHTGVVAQDNILFSATLRENITYGMGAGNGLPVATDAMVEAACAAANASEFIAEFPNGLSTLVGEKGVKLSGGQKQRIAIARAIIRSPPILLLDEATSALDSVNEREVQKALDEMLKMHKGVALVIAHRLTTIKNCDQIVVIDRGQKVATALYKSLYFATRFAFV